MHILVNMLPVTCLLLAAQVVPDPRQFEVASILNTLNKIYLLTVYLFVCLFVCLFWYVLHMYFINFSF
jgi:hypothetical protein